MTAQIAERRVTRQCPGIRLDSLRETCLRKRLEPTALSAHRIARRLCEWAKLRLYNKACLQVYNAEFSKHSVSFRISGLEILVLS
jgi:hypothetical protein